MTNDKIISSLLEFYYDEKAEFWHHERLSRIEAYKYHESMLTAGNIIIVSDGEILCGYVEYWRITYEQFGRIVCGEPFSAIHENVQNGQLSYVANTYIRPEYRNTAVYKQLRNRYFEINEQCTHFCGTARRKKSEPVKVFKKEDIMKFNKVEA